MMLERPVKSVGSNSATPTLLSAPASVGAAGEPAHLAEIGAVERRWRGTSPPQISLVISAPAGGRASRP
jgi:hypothetical protein